MHVFKRIWYYGGRDVDSRRRTRFKPSLGKRLSRQQAVHIERSCRRQREPKEAKILHNKGQKYTI